MWSRQYGFGWERKRCLLSGVSVGCAVYAVPSHKLWDSRPKQRSEQKTDTMKTYILRTPETVEPQKQPKMQAPGPQSTPTSEAPALASASAQPNPKASGPTNALDATPPAATRAQTPTSLADVSSRGSQPIPLTLFIGLDVHNDSIAVSIGPSDSTEVRRYGIIGGSHDDILRLLNKLRAAHPGATFKFCYEAGPRGYPLCRFLRAHGAGCIIVAPSKIPLKPGDRVKTDRRDADQLARLYRAGELTAIYVPDPQDEAVRDLIRARYQVSKHQHRARQQLKMFLLRHNIRYPGKTAWGPAHLRYLAKIKLPFAEQQFVFQEMVDVITQAGQRLEHYDTQIERTVPGWRSGADCATARLMPWIEVVTSGLYAMLARPSARASAP